MKSSVNHLILISVITTMASLNVCAQKRFDNYQHNRKIVVTKKGPQATITETWIPVEYDSTGTMHETLKAILQNAKADSSTAKSRQGSPKYTINHVRAGNNPVQNSWMSAKGPQESGNECPPQNVSDTPKKYIAHNQKVSDK